MNNFASESVSHNSRTSDEKSGNSGSTGAKTVKLKVWCIFFFIYVANSWKRSNLFSLQGFYQQQKVDFCQNYWQKEVNSLFFGKCFILAFMWILHWYTVYSPYKHHRTSHVPPWCCHTPPCHGMIHSGMVRGTWQIAQGSDLASELPSSQSNRAFTLEPAPRSHPSRPKGSPVNVLLTGGTGHTERSMSASCWVRVWWT